MKVDELKVRKLALTDDLQRVAGCIYDTDPYIFPYLYDGNEELGKEVIINMVKGDTVYNYRNIWVAELDGEIAGIIVALCAPFKVDMAQMLKAFIDAGAVVDERFAKTYNEYYKLYKFNDIGVSVLCIFFNKFSYNSLFITVIVIVTYNWS
jgi:hypothetical protein